jgi:hypothetical protein
VAHDIFISYSSKDKVIADAVCAKLEENGVRVWIAPRDVLAGADFAESIVDAIDNSKLVVLIWSARANHSGHILNEVNQAFDQGIAIIPFRIQDVPPDGAMRYYIGRTHWLDAIDPPLEKHIARLVQIVLTNLGHDQDAKAKLVTPEQSKAVVPAGPPPPSARQVVPTEDLDEEAGAEKDAPARPSRPTERQRGSRAGQPGAAGRRKLSLLIPIAAGGLVILAAAILLATGVFRRSPATESQETSAWVEEVNEIAEPILALLKEQPPDFADDFSQLDPAWQYHSDNFEQIECFQEGNLILDISEGVMHCTLANCPTVALQYPWMPYGNFVLQLEVDFQQASLGLEFRMWNMGPPQGGTLLDFFLSGNRGEFGFMAMKGDEPNYEQRGPIYSDSSHPITVTIINRSPNLIVYIDSTPVVSYQISPGAYEGPFGLDLVVFHEGDEFPGPETLQLDNVSIWDLDKIEGDLPTTS